MMNTKMFRFAISVVTLTVLSVMILDATPQENKNTITPISDLVRYTDSYIRGEVVRILDEDEFRLRDDSGRIKVYTGWRNTNVVKQGEIVTVKGALDPGIFKEFYAREIIRENGDVIRLIPNE